MILYPDCLRRLLVKLLKGLNLRWFSPIPLIIGILCIFASDMTPHPWFIIIIGALASGKGIYLLVSPKEHTDSIIKWWTDNAKDTTYRLLGLIALILGITLFSWF